MVRSARVRIVVAFLRGALVAGACATTETPQREAAPTPATAAPGAVEARDELLALADLPIAGGGTFDPDDVAGLDVLLWFWGPH